MESETFASPDEQIALIQKHQQKVAARISSPLRSYLLLGVLWAIPIATVPFGVAWSFFTFVAVVVCSLLWGNRITQKTGVKMMKVSADSPEANWGAFLIFGWLLATAVAGLGLMFDTPAVAWVTAALSVASTTLSSWKIDRLMFADGSKYAVAK